MRIRIQAIFRVYAPVAAIIALKCYAQDISVPHNNAPGAPATAHLPAAGNASYGQQPGAIDPSPPHAALPTGSGHDAHGYAGHGAPVPQYGAPPKQLTLWEQSSGATEIPTHSWQPPLTQENLSQWDVAMSTVPGEGFVVLMSGEANRTGQFWHRNAIPPVHFELQFGFGIFGKNYGAPGTPEGAASTATVPDGFAFWYVYEPYASVYPRSPEEQASWNLMGYKGNPKGFGVIFKVADRDGHINPSISCIHNTQDDRTLASELPSSSAFFYQYRNRATPVLFRVIVGSQGVVAQIRESVTSAWVTVCSLDHVHLHPHGFLGFTGHNRPLEGQTPQPAGQAYQQQHATQQLEGDQVLIYFVKLWSLDPVPPSPPAQVSQSPVVAPHGKQIANEPQYQHAHVQPYGGYATSANPPLETNSSQTPTEQTILRILTSIGNQLSMLSVEVSDLRNDLKKHWGEEGSGAVKSLQSELTGFKDLFNRHSQQHISALNTIHQQVQTKAGPAKEGHGPILSRLTDLSSQLENELAVKHAHSFLLSVAAIVLVVLFAVCSWKKLRALEKKHML